MSGNKSKDKGSRFERDVGNTLRGHGIDAKRVPLSESCEGFRGDVLCDVLDVWRTFQCKRSANGHKIIYGDLADNYALAIRADRQEPLIVLRLEDFCELLRCAMTSQCS